MEVVPDREPTTTNSDAYGIYMDNLSSNVTISGKHRCELWIGWYLFARQP
jgi:hypothetical protein